MQAVRILAVTALLLGAAVAFDAPAVAHGGIDRCTSSADIPDPGDQDCDGVRTDGNGPADNCPSVRNADQKNTDSGYTATSPEAKDDPSATMVAGDGSGDACDGDDDADGVADMRDADGDGRPDTVVDNCRLVRNPRQYGEAGNPYGGESAPPESTKLCPPADRDGDGAPDDVDNCPDANPSQEDLDSDGRGDACDGDDDSDNVPDGIDNCPRIPNETQEDNDHDGVGRICDRDELIPPQGEGAGVTPGPPDTTTPTVRVGLSRRARLPDLLGGLPTPVRCSERCTFAGALRLPARAARRMHVSRSVAHSQGFVDAAGQTFLFWRPSGAVRRALRRHHGRIRLQMTVTAKDQAGNERSLRRRVLLIS